MPRRTPPSLRVVSARGEPATVRTSHTTAASEPCDNHAGSLEAPPGSDAAQALAEICRLALDASSLIEAADAIVEALDRMLPSTGRALAVVTDDGESLHYIAGRGSGSMIVGARVPVRISHLGEGDGRTEPIVVKNARAAAHASIAPRLPDEPCIIVPLISRQRPIGLIAQFGGGGEQRALEHTLALQHLAPSIGLALSALTLHDEERRQRDWERMLAGALATFEQPVFIVGTDGRVLYANGAALRDYRFDADEMQGMLLDRVTAVPVTTSEQAELYCALAERGVWTTERAQRRKDGSEFPATVTWSVIENESHQQVGLVVHVRDLTDDRRVAEQFRQAEKLAALGELVAAVAHEVNNPLTGISAFAQMLLEEEHAPDVRDSIRLIKREADRATGVMHDLLVFARESRPRIAAVDPNALIEQSLRLRAYSLRGLGVDVETQLGDDIGLLRADPQRLQQVLLNLIVNAEHAMECVAHRRLTIRTWRDGDRIVLEIGDSGIGMTPEVQQHIFEPFFTTKAEGVGTGLGLSVSYGIIQSHGGTVSVESAPNAGSIFRISLPSQQFEASDSDPGSAPVSRTSPRFLPGSAA